MRTILVVDDEPDILDLSRELFGMMGFAVVTAESGMKAMELLRCTRVDAIISDISMPEMDGKELFFRLKEEGLLVNPFFFVTGYAELGEEAVKLMQEGVDGIFQKPFQVNEIAARLKERLGIT